MLTVQGLVASEINCHTVETYQGQASQLCGSAFERNAGCSAIKLKASDCDGNKLKRPV